MDKQNITLSLSKETIRKAKLFAVQQHTSLSAMLTHALEEIVAQNEQYDAHRRSSEAILNQGFDLGTQGQVTWRREDVHER